MPDRNSYAKTMSTRIFSQCGEGYSSAASEYVLQQRSETAQYRSTRALLYDYFNLKCAEFITCKESHTLIVRMTERKFASFGWADEALNYVEEKLCEGRFQRIRKFKGGNKSSYLKTVIVRLLVDFGRSKNGRKRAPKFIQDMGEYYVTIHRMLCFERRPAEEIKIKLASTGIDILDKDIRLVRAADPGCGEYNFTEQFDERIYVSGEEKMSEGKATVVSILEHLLSEKHPDERVAAAARIETNIRKIELSESDLVGLHLVYVNDMSIAAAARKLGLADHILRRRQAEILKQLKKVFDKQELESPNGFQGQ